ncbi:hypothetical protein, partial [Actinoplanes italicus]
MNSLTRLLTVGIGLVTGATLGIGPAAASAGHRQPGRTLTMPTGHLAVLEGIPARDPRDARAQLSTLDRRSPTLSAAIVSPFVRSSPSDDPPPDEPPASGEPAPATPAGSSTGPSAEKKEECEAPEDKDHKAKVKEAEDRERAKTSTYTPPADSNEGNPLVDTKSESEKRKEAEKKQEEENDDAWAHARCVIWESAKDSLAEGGKELWEHFQGKSIEKYTELAEKSTKYRPEPIDLIDEKALQGTFDDAAEYAKNPGASVDVGGGPVAQIGDAGTDAAETLDDAGADAAEFLGDAGADATEFLDDTGTDAAEFLDDAGTDATEFLDDAGTDAAEFLDDAGTDAT